jgi:hypothetical protein
MNKYPLIGVSICAVVLLVLGSLSNVVGYQTVQSSNQQIINEEVNQKELLFQTIVDMANNKEIQRIILKSQIGRGIFPTSEFPVVTKNQLKMMYFIGLMLSKVVSKSRMQSIVEKYQFSNQLMQKEISVVIEKDVSLNAEITQLSNSECDCENENTTGLWKFPVICLTLNLLWWFFVVLYFVGISIAEIFVESIGQIAIDIDCFWTHY